MISCLSTLSSGSLRRALEALDAPDSGRRAAEREKSREGRRGDEEAVGLKEAEEETTDISRKHALGRQSGAQETSGGQ